MPLLLLLLVAGVVSDPLAPQRLRVEYLTDPVGIDVRVPRFSWAVAHTSRAQTQIAYRVLVELRGQGSTELVWDSGRVVSSRSVNIEYSGVNLRAHTGMRLQNY